MPELDVTKVGPRYMGITTLMSHRAKIVYREPIPNQPLASTLITLPGSYASIDEAHAIAQQMNDLALSTQEAIDYVVLRRNGHLIV